MCRRLIVVVALAVGLYATRTARAQESERVPEDHGKAEETRAGGQGREGFGPEVTIEKIEVVGNTRTAARLIKRALLVKEGEVLHTGDPRFRTSRFAVLALGYFLDAHLELRKGSTRGAVILTVQVWERGTLILNWLFFGTSEATPLWLGIDFGDSNFVGTGVGLGAAVVWAEKADLTNAHDQLALRLRYADPSLLGLPVGTHATALFNDASEPYRAVANSGDAPANFAAFSHRRVGGMAGAEIDLTRHTGLSADARVERVDATTPAGIDVNLKNGVSWVSTLSLGFFRDTASDPVLPHEGDRARAGVELGAGDYTFAKLQARYDRWFPLGGIKHVLSVHGAAGAIFGDAPIFDRFYVGDIDVLLPSRALDLVVSTRASSVFLHGSDQRPRYGEYAASGAVEYSYRLFRGRHRFYGGDLFVGAGIFVLDSRRALGSDPGNRGAADLMFDAGLRLDTEVGVFELSLANALGRVPL